MRRAWEIINEIAVILKIKDVHAFRLFYVEEGKQEKMLDNYESPLETKDNFREQSISSFSSYFVRKVKKQTNKNALTVLGVDGPILLLKRFIFFPSDFKPHLFKQSKESLQMRYYQALLEVALNQINLPMDFYPQVLALHLMVTEGPIDQTKEDKYKCLERVWKVVPEEYLKSFSIEHWVSAARGELGCRSRRWWCAGASSRRPRWTRRRRCSSSCRCA